MKYKIWFEEWITHYIKPANKQRTFERYAQTAYAHILPALGECELNELDPLTLQKFVSELVINGNKRTGQGLSPNFVKTIVSILQNSLRTAYYAGLVSAYSADKIKCPKVIEKQVECFTLEEQKRIEAEVLSSKKKKYMGIILCLYTGLRIGELLALTWNDIDLAKGILSVNKTCHDASINGNHVRVIDTPKTENSRRQIPLSKSMIRTIKELKKYSQSEYIIADGKDPVFVRSYQRTFELLLHKLDIPHKGFHSRRHTFATRALECGMDVKSLSEILGHKNATITLNRYAHSLWEHKAEMMDKVSKML